MQDCRAVATLQELGSRLMPNEADCIDKQKYQSLIGNLACAVTGTRPDISQVLGSVNQFSSSPGNVHWKSAKRIMRYIKGTLDCGILFDETKETEIQLREFIDPDWGSDPNGRKSSSGNLFTLCEGVIS